MCQIVIISHNSARFEKLTICIVCYIINHQNSKVHTSPLTKSEMFSLKHHLAKSEISFSFDWDYPMYFVQNLKALTVSTYARVFMIVYLLCAI